MELERILAELQQERDRLDAAIAALTGVRRGARGPRARSTYTGRRRRTMSAAARKRISQAMKRRWAERKKKSAA